MFCLLYKRIFFVFDYFCCELIDRRVNRLASLEIQPRISSSEERRIIKFGIYLFCEIDREVAGEIGLFFYHRVCEIANFFLKCWLLLLCYFLLHSILVR